MDFERIKREEEEAIKLMQSEENPSEETEAPSVPDFDLDTDSVDQPTESQETNDEDVEVEVNEKQRVSWKKRYTTFKSYADKTIHDLRIENKRLAEIIEGVQKETIDVRKELAELKSKAASTKRKEDLNNVFTKEDEDIVGPEALAIMRKAMDKSAELDSEKDKEIAGLKEELEKLKLSKPAKRDIKSFREELSDRFPKLNQIDSDPKFGNWLKDPNGFDEDTGLQRMEAFNIAVNSTNVHETLKFFKEYDSLKSNKKNNVLESKITPTGSGASEVNENASVKKTYTIQEYENFMDDVARGKYKGREKDARIIEKRFDKAFEENRVLG